MQRAQLFIGRLPREIRRGDLEDIFKRYGRITRCDVRMGLATAYAFIDFDDHRDAQDALKYENGRDIRGQRMVVEWAIDDPKHGRSGGRRGGYSNGDRGRRNFGRSRSRSRSRSASLNSRRNDRRRISSRSRSRSQSRSPSPSYNNRRSEKLYSRSRSRSTSR